MAADPPRHPPLGLRRHERRPRRPCSATTRRTPACCGCRTARRCGSARRRSGQGLRGLPWRGQQLDARRGRALPGLRRRARAPGRPGAAHQPVPRSATSTPRHCRAESQELLALESLRGAPVARPADRARRPTRGSTPVPRARRSSCSSSASASSTCPARSATTTRAGQRLGGSLIPQGHPTGYPIYRLEWQGLGSLQRRLRDCMSGVRAEPFAHGDPATGGAGAVPGARAAACDGDPGRAAVTAYPRAHKTGAKLRVLLGFVPCQAHPPGGADP